ncbi:MAG: pyroglutamyl-peptidase I [Betaproteobacteria bacterium]|nr:pyroglutamyl-peptidase I [Betaproteobacteria bacterium]
MRALVTGFDPFGGGNVNASLEAVRRLPSRIGAIEVATATLPTSYARALAVLDEAIVRAGPRIVLCVGQAGDRAVPCVERVAINVQDARTPDNDGAQPVDLPVIAGGPPAYFSTLPIKAAVAALHAGGVPAEVSNSAGTFVCNHVFYGLMHLAATRMRAIRGGFLHVPALPGIGAHHGSAPPVSLDDIVRGIGIVLTVTASNLSEIDRTAAATR